MNAIARAWLRPFCVALREPLATAAGSIEARTGVLVVLEDRAGRVGVGEASPLPGRLAGPVENLPACREALARAVEGLEGCDPESVLAGDGSEVVPLAARFALESALIDLVAQARGVCGADWLAGGRAPHDRVPVNALVGGGDAGAVGRAARCLVARGYGTFKLKVGMDGLGDDIERVASLRQAVGSRACVRLDANGAWSPEQAEEAVAALARLEVEYIEDPICIESRSDVACLAALRAASPVPLAVDECTADPDLLCEVLAKEAADRLILKPPSLGGLRATRRRVRDAAAQGVACVLTSSIDTAVGLAATLHLAASLPGAAPACGLGTAEWLAEDVAPPPAVRQGVMALPEGPGMGVVVAL